MAKPINIRRDVTDPFYRYKMEPLVSKIEGKGNGIKSVIVNLSSVAQSLARNPQCMFLILYYSLRDRRLIHFLDLVKFFGFELGAQVKANPTDDRWIINGAHDAAKLQDYLDGFINKFVLCNECKNPETDLKITKDKQGIMRDCKACGKLTPIDPSSRLFGFIMKNPPDGSGSSGKKTGRKERKGKSKVNGDDEDKEKNGNGNGNGNGSGSGEGSDNGEIELEANSDDEFTRRITAEAKTLAPTEDAKDDEDDWAVDMSEEAVRKRQEELAKTLKATNIDDDEEEGGENPYDTLGSWIMEERTKDGEIDDIEVYKKAAELGIATKHKTLQVLAQTLFNEDVVKKKQIDEHAALLKKLITSERHERAFLGGIERFVGNDYPKLINSIPNILMSIYQNDLVSEDVIKAWGSKASKKYVDIAVSKKVRKASEPFIKWLDEADAESDDDDE